MQILVACEESQAVTIALRKLGHEAYSCDLIPCSGGHPEWHIQQDVLPLLNGYCFFKTCDGSAHYVLGRWDMLIAFPPCTYLTNASAVRMRVKGEIVAGIIKRGHEAVLEHFDITVKFVCDRGVSHEIVRHRMASYCQESTRYCNYSKDGFGGEITVIRPFYLVEGTEGWQYWKEACWTAERRYFELLNWGCTPQEARAVLPTSLKTEVAIPLLHQMRSQVPVIFDDIEEAAQ